MVDMSLESAIRSVSMNETENQLARLSALGDAVRMRRVQRGMATREEFAEQVSLGYRVLTDLENGARRLGPKSYGEIEEALAWPPGSCETILAGGTETTTDLDHLERLGKLVQARRIQKGWRTREAFAEQLSFSYRVLCDLENGKRTLGNPSYREVETLLDWTTGSIDTVLAGGEPTLRHATVSSGQQTRGVGRLVIEIDEYPLPPPGPQTMIGDLLTDADSSRNATWALYDGIHQAIAAGAISTERGAALTQQLDLALGCLADVVIRLMQARVAELSQLLEAKGSSDAADVDEPSDEYIEEDTRRIGTAPE